jgi:hypothetical protein
MVAQAGLEPDWRDAAAYAPLLGADRSFFAWEWLRRQESYRLAAQDALSTGAAGAAVFGLVAFERANLSVPAARPMWSASIHPHVLRAVGECSPRPADRIDFSLFKEMLRLKRSGEMEHLLLSDGLRTVRVDGPTGLFSSGAACLRYLIGGIASAEAPLLTLRRLLALCRTGGFSKMLHRPEPRARRWILMLRAFDAIAAGAGQRQIAGELLSRSAEEPGWRDREPSIRSQAQRLVRSARLFANGGYRALLR